MCYFLHVRLILQNQPDAAQTLMTRLAKSHGFYLQGQFPEFVLTNGHCSCDYVQVDGNSLILTAFLDGLVKAASIKAIEIGWVWGERMPSDAEVVRLALQEFLKRNEAADLKPDVWYRLNDPQKYAFPARS